MPDFPGRGFRIHYEDRGSGDSVVFLHGYLMEHHLFDAQVARLSTHYRCVAPDRRGHGNSECPPGPWTITDLVDDVVALVQRLAVGPCHLVGMSIGGAEVTRIALDHSELVRSLVYVDAPADPQLPEGASFDPDEVAERGLSPELLELSGLVLYGERFRTEHPEEIAEHVERIRQLPNRTIGEGLRINLNTQPVSDRLGEIGMPALVIHGSDDVALPLDVSASVAAGIPGARLELIEGAGHSCPIEAPDEVTAAIELFLGSLN
ncbi:MAG: alpha/beta fold hydrolase [Solirubrobacterales bacterium]